MHSIKSNSRNFIGAAFAAVLVFTSAAVAFSQEAILQQGTALGIVLSKDVSSKDTERGQAVKFAVADDVVVNGQTLVKKGTEASGTVIYSEKGGYMGKSGKLALQIESTSTADGKPLPLIAAKGGEGSAKTGTVLALSYIAGPFALLMKGDNAVVKAGTKIEVYTAEERRFKVEGEYLVAVEVAKSDSSASAEVVTVYIYRPKKMVGGALEPSVYCDGVELARMDNGRYFTLKLAPGKHIIHMTDKAKGYEMNMAAGQTYYFRVGIEAGMWKGGGKLLLEDSAKGADEVKKVKPLDAEKIKDKTMVVMVVEPVKN